MVAAAATRVAYPATYGQWAMPWLTGEVEPAGPAAEMDPATRATLILALLAIVVLGVGMIAMVILGGQMVRRWSRFSPATRPLPKPRPHVPIDLSTLSDELDPPKNAG